MGQRRTIFTGRVIDVGVDSVVLPNGLATELEIVRHPGGSAVVALDERSQLCLLRQYRHAADGWLWELPAGKREAAEPPEQTARRELADEAGVTASRWESLGLMRSSPAVFTEVIHLFLARELTRGRAAPDRDEVIEVHWLPFSEALERARSGEIEDAKTLVGIFRAATVIG